LDEYQNASLPPLPGELQPGVTAPLPPPAPPKNDIFIGPLGLRAGWRALIYIVLFVFTTLLLTFAAVPLVRRVAGGRGSGLSPGATIVTELASLAGLFLTLLLIGLFEKRPVDSYGLPMRRALRGNFWRGAALGFVSLTGLLVAIRSLHGFYFGVIALSGRSLLYYIFTWAIAFFLVGVFEEYSFRGYLQFVLTRGVGFWPAALVTSLLFGAVHKLNPGESWVGLTAVVAVGLFFCLTLRRTGSLWFAVGFHMAWDYAQTFVYGVADSGFPSVGHLFNSHFQQGPKWLTGGTVGPEASWLVFPVLGIAALVVARLYPGAKYPEPEVPAVAAASPSPAAIPQV
jgi:membrane protease YdiL (CAAX protease family)